MSMSSKKRKRHEAREESLGGAFPKILVDDQHEGVWLMWVYHVAPFYVRVEIPVKVKEANCPWLYVDGNDECLDGEAKLTQSETQYGALTRIRLMETFKAAIVADQAAGLAQLEAAATAAGLYGKRERRRCVIPTWTTQDDTAAVQALN